MWGRVPRCIGFPYAKGHGSTENRHAIKRSTPDLETFITKRAFSAAAVIATSNMCCIVPLKLRMPKKSTEVVPILLRAKLAERISRLSTLLGAAVAGSGIRLNAAKRRAAHRYFHSPATILTTL
jgi:hypothetical protein